MKRVHVLAGILVMVIVLALLKPWLSKRFPILQRIRGKHTVSDRIEQYGPKVRPRLEAAFVEKGLPYPPKKIVFLGLKHESLFEVYDASSDKGYVKVLSYPILAASGGPGPKLREGDMQVPEGFYRIEFLNPNSLYHLSLRVNYPNDFDRRMAQEEGRSNLGGDIMIHGSDVSIGCLALGDEASEELFVLAADTGLQGISVVLSPYDFRKTPKLLGFALKSEWAANLHRDIAEFLKQLPN